MVNVAVVGLGHWGPNLVRNLSMLQDVNVTALCDVDEHKAETTRRRFCAKARVVHDYHELADDPHISAIVVATPIRTHHQLGETFLAAGKHVLIEKPLARTVDECQRLIDLARRHNRILMVGHVFAYNAAVRWVRDYLDRGELGRLFYVYSQRVNLGRIQHDVSALWSFAPHDVSILHYWFGTEPVRVSARGFSYVSDGIQDVVFVMLEYPGGIGVHLHLGWLDPRKVRLMTLVGSKKMLVYDDVSQDSKIQICDKGIANLHDFLEAPESFAEFQFLTRTGDITIPTVPFSEPLQNECQHFIDCVRQERQPLTGGIEGLQVVRVLEAAERSLQQDGQSVVL